MPMRLFVSGGAGALGRALLPFARLAGHDVLAPSHRDVDLFDPGAVATAVAGCGAVLHLATRIPALAALGRREAWHENDACARTRPGSSSMPRSRRERRCSCNRRSPSSIRTGSPPTSRRRPARSSRSCARRSRPSARRCASPRPAAAASSCGSGCSTGRAPGQPQPNGHFGATIHVADAATALLAALGAPSGIYNICRDGERVANARFRRATGSASTRGARHRRARSGPDLTESRRPRSPSRVRTGAPRPFNRTLTSSPRMLVVLGDRDERLYTHRKVDATLALLPAHVEAAWVATDSPRARELGDRVDAIWLVPAARTAMTTRLSPRSRPLSTGRSRSSAPAAASSTRASRWRAGPASAACTPRWTRSRRTP